MAIHSKTYPGYTRPGKSKYTESELVLPALYAIAYAKASLSTSHLIASLEATLRPKGHDAKLLAGRKDTHFSQKVRNLKSHDSLTRLKLAKYKNGYWSITDAGRSFLDTNLRVVQEMTSQGFKPKDLLKKDEYDYSGIIVEEGALTVGEAKFRRRSNLVKVAAIVQFKKTNSNHVFCTICNFSFENRYGQLGKDYIEVHHIKPIHETDIKGEKAKLTEALKKVALVCSNCHRMIHRKKDKMLSITEMKKTLREP